MPEGITRQGSVSPRRSSTHTEQNEQKTNEAKNNYSLFEECYEKVFPGIDKFLKPDDRGNLRSTSNTIHKIPADKKLSLNITIKSEEAYLAAPQRLLPVIYEGMGGELLMGTAPLTPQPLEKYIERRIAQQKDIKQIQVTVEDTSAPTTLALLTKRLASKYPAIQFTINLSEVSREMSDRFVETLRILTRKEASEWENLTIIPSNKLTLFESRNYDETVYENYLFSATSELISPNERRPTSPLRIGGWVNKYK